MAITAIGSLTGGWTLHAGDPPTIKSSPADTVLIAGADFKLTVDVSGDDPMEYQWFRGGQPVAGATDDELMLRDVTPSDAGEYSVSMTNPYGSVVSIPAEIQVLPFLIKTQPAAQIAEAGDDPRLQVEVQGESPFSFQWFRNEAPVTGATGTKLELKDVMLSDDAIYRVRVTNPYGTIESAPAHLQIVQAPVILEHPGGASVAEGDAVTLSVQAIGTPAPQFQWFREGKSIAGATATDHRIAAISPAEAGKFKVRVSNPYGSTDSQECIVRVIPAPVILAQPESQSVRVGVDVSFSIDINLNPAPACQWFFNGEPMAGEHGLSLRVNDVEPWHAGVYTVSVENAAGQALSEPAVLSVDISEVVARIDNQPNGDDILAGGDVTFEIKTAGVAPLDIQWRHNGVDIPGATSAKPSSKGFTYTRPAFTPPGWPIDTAAR